MFTLLEPVGQLDSLPCDPEHSADLSGEGRNSSFGKGLPLWILAAVLSERLLLLVFLEEKGIQKLGFFLGFDLVLSQFWF